MFSKEDKSSDFSVNSFKAVRALLQKWETDQNSEFCGHSDPVRFTQADINKRVVGSVMTG